jgi:hypothetical protein
VAAAIVDSHDNRAERNPIAQAASGIIMQEACQDNCLPKKLQPIA